jgi:putative heme-binding domain-containing protein
LLPAHQAAHHRTGQFLLFSGQLIQRLGHLCHVVRLVGSSHLRGLVSRQQAIRSRLPERGRAGALLADLLREARATATDEKSKPEERVAAIRTLGLTSFGEIRGLFAGSLGARQPRPVQQAVLETLARFDDPTVAVLLLDAWPGLSPQLRATATETLFARPVWVSAFLDAVEQGKVKSAEVDPARMSLLQASADERTRTRAARLFAGARLGKRQEVVAAYQGALELKGDSVRGKAIFKAECSACHRLEGVGTAVGADLSAIRDRGLEAVLLNILDPNREVKPQYLSYVLVTDTGRTITGMITAETANSVTLRRLDGTGETVARSNIEELRSSGMSFMPEGLEKRIDVRGMADLLAYLSSVR